MAKVVLDDVGSGYNLQKINTNFQKIEDALNDQVLFRDNPSGEVNGLESDVDVNGKRLYNLPEPVNLNEAARLKDVQDAVSGVTNANLISASDDAGGTLWTTVQGFITKIISTSGASVVGYIAPYANAVARTLSGKAGEFVSVIDFGADPTGVVDSVIAINRALNSGAMRVFIPRGVYRITASINVPNYVTLYGEGHGLFAGTGATRILKYNAVSYPGVIVNGASQLHDLSVEGTAGSLGDGVYILGGRSEVKNVSTFNNGNDGFRIGAYPGTGVANTNIWRMYNCIARANARHGLYVSHTDNPTLPDCNAGLLSSFEATSNGVDGVRLEYTIDNNFVGIVAQGNAGYGIRCVLGAKGNNFVYPYIEANTTGEVRFDVGADRNFYSGWRSGSINDGVSDLGADNQVGGRNGSITNTPLNKGTTGFNIVRFIESTTSGLWDVYKEATSRNLNLSFISTSSTADLNISTTGTGEAGIRFGTGGITAAQRSLLRTSPALNFGSIPTNATVDVTVTMAGASGSYEFTITPIHAIPAGITWGVFWNGSNVIARCSNTTGGAITVNGTFTVVGRKIV